ncbi:hypothetical protein VD0003_g3851 [Verticillium dahliae]|nr:hypothetical protein VD0003_g3851 [Verticillium dahliae]
MDITADEKRPNSPPDELLKKGAASDFQWSEEEEKKLLRKIDFVVMPLLIAGFFALQLDRGNIGNALTDNFFVDVGITQNQFNVGQQLLSVGIILLEIPSNLILYRVGPTLWIGGQIVACLHMRGIARLAGWQWLFILEGIFTVLIGIGFLTTFPNKISDPVSNLGYRYFTEREAQIIYERVLRDDPTKAQPKRHVTWAEIKSTLTNWRLLPHLGFTIAGLAPPQAFGSYAPSLVVSFGFGRLESNALVSIGSWGLMFVNLLFGWSADKLGVRGPFVSLGFLLGFAFNIGNRILVESTNSNLKFGILICSIAFSWPWHAINGSWLALNAKTAGERSITMALHIMAANCSGIIGKQLFRSEDAPLYRTGFSVIAGLSAAAFVLSIVANVQYYFLNGQQLRKTGLKFMY